MIVLCNPHGCEPTVNIKSTIQIPIGMSGRQAMTICGTVSDLSGERLCMLKATHVPISEKMHSTGNESTKRMIRYVIGFDAEPGASNIIGVKSSDTRPGISSVPQTNVTISGRVGRGAGLLSITRPKRDLGGAGNTHRALRNFRGLWDRPAGVRRERMQVSRTHRSRPRRLSGTLRPSTRAERGQHLQR